MAVSSRHDRPDSSLNLVELCLELAQLPLTNPKTLGSRIVRLLAEHLGTDRVSLVLLAPDKPCIVGMFQSGFSLKKSEWQESSKVISEVVRHRSRLFVYDIRAEHADLLAPWADTYRTDAFAAIPLFQEHHAYAVVCISNLSRQQLIQLENAGPDWDLLVAQLHQLCALLPIAGIEEESCEPAPDDELGLISELIERLGQTLDTRNVYSVFIELISQYVPLDMLAIVHDSLNDVQHGVLCVRRPAHHDDLSELFAGLSSQWQRRHRRAPSLELEQAVLLGGELVQREGDCPAELRMGCTETFPIFLDNDLFALILVSTTEEVLTDRHRMRLFSILAHHLMLDVKKGLLLAQNQEMQTLDSLTGLYNERHFFQMMDREFDRAARYNVPLCLLIIDVDHFKDVNETYGFETGDLLLREISRILMENMRTTDFVSRYSGERFVIVLPETHNKNSEIMANRLRRFIENNSFYIPNTNVFIKVTVSIGVASYLDHKPTSLAQFIEFADTALYFAKRGGRNQVVGYTYVINMMMRDTDNEG